MKIVHSRMPTKAEFIIMSPIRDSCKLFLLSSRTTQAKYLQKKKFLIEFVDKKATIYLCSINFFVYITNFQTSCTRHHCYIIQTFYKLLFSLDSQLSLKWYKHVYPKLATSLHTKQRTSPATTAFCFHSVHNRQHTTAVIGLANSQCLITLQSLTRNRACWIKR
jgi:hypothetical protein